MTDRLPSLSLLLLDILNTIHSIRELIIASLSRLSSVTLLNFILDYKYPLIKRF